MLFITYYSKNYASIIHQGLTLTYMYMYIPKLIVLYNCGVCGFESHPRQLTTLTLCVHLLCLVSFSLMYMIHMLLLLQVPVYILIELQNSITNVP